MSIKLCQAANSVVTPLDDAQLYSWIANRAVGVVAGCTVTSAGTNQLSIAAGWGIVQGHVFTIGAETISAAVAPSGTVNGRLLIRIDTSDADTPVQFVTQAATPLPALTQEAIDGSGSIYELPLATYTVGTISISGLTNVAAAIRSPSDAVWKSIAVPTPSVSGNVRTYTFNMAGKAENEIGLRIFANGYLPIDLRVLPAPYAGAYIVSYQDANLTSRTIVTVSVGGETLTISVNSISLSTSDAYSVIGMFLWR